LVNQSTTVVSRAVAAGDQARSTIEALAEDVARIGVVTHLISDIAAKTNLLALNATIEAARAGDAGKGFAVVAREVKDLAGETSRATEDITSKIAAIQATTTQAMEAIGRITAVIDQINENQTTIAAAVEEQSATTSEISRSVADVSAGSDQIAGTIGNIAESAANTSKGAGATQQSAQELAALASRVQVLVHQFRY